MKPLSPTYWNGGRLVEHHDVFILMDDPQWLRCDWRLVTVYTMTDEVIVVDHRIHGSKLAIH